MVDCAASRNLLWRGLVLLGIFMCAGFHAYAEGWSRMGGPSSQAAGKRSDSIQGAEEEKIRERTISRIVDILRGIANGSRDWPDILAAARVQAQVADLTWEVDRVGARNYLLLAWQTAKTVKEKQEGRGSHFRNDSPRRDGKREVLVVARKRAPELAKQWMEELSREVESENQAHARGVFDDRTTRSQVLLQMASDSVSDNPSAAVEMAMDSLSDGISFGLQYVLLRLQEKDFALAKRVFRAALERLATFGFTDPDELVVLYSYLFTPGRVFAANTTESQGSRQLSVSRDPIRVTAAADLDPALALDFLNLAANLLVNAPIPSKATDLQMVARQHISAIDILTPWMVQLLPGRAAELANRAQALRAAANFSAAPNRTDSATPFVAPMKGESKEELAVRQVDAWEAKAQKEPNSLTRDIDYTQAAIATLPQAYQRGWDLAGRINDPQLKQGVSNYISYRAALHFAGAGQFEKAHVLSLANSDPAQRAITLVVAAQRLVRAANTQLGAQYLQEARAIVGGAEPSEEWTRIAMGIVSTFGQFDNDTALIALADAVKLVDRFPLAASGDERAPMLLRFSGFKIPDLTYGTNGFGLEAMATVFDLDHFWRALGVVNTIRTPETQGVVTITMCRQQLNLLKNSKVKNRPPIQ